MSDDAPIVIPVDNPSKLPRDTRLIEYTNGDLELSCKDFLAKFHKLPDVVYQYQYRYFFPLTEEIE